MPMDQYAIRLLKAPPRLSRRRIRTGIWRTLEPTIHSPGGTVSPHANTAYVVRNVVAHVSLQDGPGVRADGAVATKGHVVGSVIGGEEEVAVAGEDAVDAVGVRDVVAEVGRRSAVDWRAVDKKRTIAGSLGLSVVECTPAGGLTLVFDVVSFDAVGVRCWEGEGKIDGEEGEKESGGMHD